MSDTAELIIEVKDNVTPGAASAKGALDALIKSSIDTLAELKNIATAMQHVSAAAKDAEHAVSKGGHAAHGMGESGALAGLKTIAGLEEVQIAGEIAEKAFEFAKEAIGTVIEVGEQLFERFEKIENISKVFTLREGKEGEERLKRMVEQADEMGVRIDVIRDVAGKLEKAFDPSDAEIMSKIIFDLSAKLPNSADAARDLTEQFSKIATKGKDIATQGSIDKLNRQLGNQAQLYDGIALSLGKTKAEVMAMIKAHQLTNTQLIRGVGAADLLANKTDKFGEAARNIAKMQVGAQINRIKNSFDELQDTLAENIFSSPELVTGISTLGEKLREFAKNPAVQKFLKDLASSLVYLALNAMPLMADGIDKMNEAFKWINDNHDALQGALTGLAIVFGVLALTTTVMLLPLIILVGVLGAIVVGVGYAASQIIENWDAIGDAFNDSVDAIEKPFKTIASSIMALMKAPQDMKQIGTDMMAGLIEGLVEQLPGLGSVVKDIAGTVKKVLAGELDMHSPSVVMAEMGANVSKGFAMGIDSGQGDVAGASSGLGNSALNAVGSHAGSGGGGGGMSIGNITTEVHIAGSSADGGTIADAVSAATRKVVVDVMLQMMSLHGAQN